MVVIPKSGPLWTRVGHLFSRVGKFLMSDTNYPGYGWYAYSPELLKREISPTEHHHNDDKTDSYRQGYAIGAGVALRSYREGIPRHFGHIHDEMNDYGEPDWAEGYCAGYTDMWESFS